MLIDKTNQMKADDDFSDWIQSRTEEYKQTHHIPENAAEMTFTEFAEAREELIKTHILSTQPI